MSRLATKADLDELLRRMTWKIVAFTFFLCATVGSVIVLVARAKHGG